MTLGLASPAAAAPSPKCPEGATYNAQTKKCVKGVTFTCPSGTTLQSDGSCIGPATPPCPEGFTLSADGTTCSGPHTCPEGYTYVSAGFCEKEETGGFATLASCPQGHRSYPVEGATDNTCNGPASGPNCPDRTSYDGSGNCEGNPALSCQSPFTLNTSTGLCESTPAGGGGSGGGGGGKPPKT